MYIDWNEKLTNINLDFLEPLLEKARDYPEFKTKTFTDLYETPQAKKIWSFLNSPFALIRMQAVSDVNKPALLGIEAYLIESYDVPERITITENDKIQFDRFKQMLGAMVRQVMEANGYRLQSNNVKVPSSRLFYSASMYCKK